MRSNKRYSNVPFTKRVDYDGGAHREPLGKGEPRVCRRCGAVYLKRRWIVATDPRAALAGPDATRTLCRACEMEAAGLSSGYLTLRGAFFGDHRQEVERLLRNEAARAAEDNPLGRIISWDRTVPGALTVTTSTEHLVERLGRALNKAFGGRTRFGFSHGNKLARASWRRD